MSELVKLKNIGAKSAQLLQSIGIHSLEDIEEQGVVEVYCRLKEAYPEITLTMLWALQGALIGLAYNRLPDDIKTDLLDMISC